MIPGLRMDVMVDVAKATYPRAWLVILTSLGSVALQLEWVEEKAIARWTATSDDRLVEKAMTAYIAGVEPGPEPLTPTAAVQLLLPIATRWIEQPIRRADSMIIWLRTELLLPQEVH